MLTYRLTKSLLKSISTAAPQDNVSPLEGHTNNMSDDEDWDKDFADDDSSSLSLGPPTRLSLSINTKTITPPSKDDEKSASSPAIMINEPKKMVQFVEEDDEPFEDFADSPIRLTGGSPISKSPSLTRSLRFQDSDEEKWDDDFDDVKEQPVMQIRGIKADPKGKEEDWDEDFDFGPSAPIGAPLLRDNSVGRKQLQMSRVHSSALMSITTKVENTLKEIHASWPTPADKQKKKSKTRNQSITELDDEFETARTYSLGGPQKIMEEAQSSLKSAIECAARGDKGEAMKHLKNAQNILGGLFQRDKDFALEAEVYYQTGLLMKAEPMEAVSHFKYAIDMMSQLKGDIDPPFKAQVYHELASCYIQLSNLSTAAINLSDCLKTLLAPPYPLIQWGQVAQATLSLCNCLKDMNLSREILPQYLHKCVEAAQLVGNFPVTRNLTENSQASDLTTQKEAEDMLQTVPDFPKTPIKPVPESPLKLRTQVVQPDTLSLSASETESDSENWDMELGLDGQQRQTLTLASTGGAPAKMNSDPEERIPKRYKFLDSLKQEVEIIKYPKATFFYTMKTSEGHKLLGEQAQESWLGNLIGKHPQALVYREYIEENANKAVRELVQEFANKQEGVKKLSIEWAKSHLIFCTLLYKLGHKDICWESLYNFFVDLVDCNITRMTLSDQYSFTHIVMSTALLAAKLWRSDDERPTEFKTMIKNIERFNPKAADLTKVLEVETAVHHKYMELDDIEPSFIMFCLVTLSNLYRKLAGTESSEAKADPSSLTPYYNEVDPLVVRARILVDIHFILNDISPLTSRNRQVSDEDRENSERKGISNGALETFILDNSELFDSNKRMQTLTEIYPQIPTCFVKAKAAYALGLFRSFEMEEHGVAEQLYLDCVYILDHCKSQIEGIPPVVSTLGTSALQRFGEVLLLNYKYQYSIAAYEAAVKILRLKNDAGLLPLIHKLATTTRENDDTKRAIEYLREVLDSYSRDNKSNEFRYVAVIISQLHRDMGDFRKAETLLLNAISKGAGVQALSSFEPTKLDHASFRLQVQLIDLYLESYTFEKGIELLEYLTTCQLPLNSAQTVLSKLTKAYIKKRWFVDASRVLSKLKEEVSKPGQGMRTNSDDLMKYYELQALLHHHSGKHTDALSDVSSSIETAINLCSSTSLAALAHYWTVRAKIFRALCSLIHITFPTTLKPNPTDPNLSSNRGTNSQAKLYTCVGDLIQECVYSYDKAYHYYKGIGDDIHIAKTVNGIVQTYLERLFCPVALLHFRYNDLARLPFFEISDFAKTAGTPGSNSKHRRTKSSVDAGINIPLTEKKEFFVSIEKIENPALCALEICAETFDPIIMAQSFMNMAELKYLQGEQETAVAFWTECKELIMSLFMEDSNYTVLLGKGMPPSMLKKLDHVFSRVTRFMFSLDSTFINQHLNVIDAYNLLQIDIESSHRRPTQQFVKSETKEELLASLEGGELSPRGSISQTKPPKIAVPSLSSVPSHLKVPSIRKPLAPESDTRFSDHKRKSVGLENNPLQKINDINEESAERIWGFLFAIKTQIANFIKGKMTQEELLSRNRKTVRKILQVKRQNELIKGSNEPETGHRLSDPKAPGEANPSTTGPAFEEFSETHPGFSRLLYVLTVEDYIIYYVPVTGSVRIQQLGGREDDDSRANIVGPQPSMRYVSIHIDNDSVTLLLPPSVTLDKLLRHLCNKSYWEQDPGESRKKSFFGSFGRNSALNSRKIKFVDRTKGFQSCLEDILAQIAIRDTPAGEVRGNREWTTEDLSLVAFAKKTINPIDSSSIFCPLNVSSSRTVAQCYSQQELKECSMDNPLRLWIYFSTGGSSTTEQTRDFLNKTVFFSKPMLTYLSNIVDDVESETAEARKSVQNVQDALFSTLIDIIPDGDPTIPVAMVISKAMALMPWELMILEPVCRYMSVMDMRAHLRKRSFVVKKDEVIPKFFSIHNSTFEKNNAQEESDRRRWILAENFKRLYVKRKTPSCQKVHHQVVPFHTPLVKLGRRVSAYKRPYKLIQWIDVSSISQPAEIVPLFKNIDMSPPSVMLFTFADLLEFNDTLQYLIRSRLECTYLFIPASKMKVVTTKLMKVAEDYLKTKEKARSVMEPQQWLMNTVSSIQNELNIPIAIMCPMT
ncbi:hypothetical protein PROFUN_13578 [Planoprotostelium fungivorum]|uniref:Uncharacterized protein n=1 Tax=Planoprotostelium fungivorum TaxID=1890364 RepID=A0A2P6N3K2_9EUKA|nr:hypothetical protein PROFUN_13578 [Planoprotostelium fungivorum]